MDLVWELGNTTSLFLHHSRVQNFLLSPPFSCLSSVSHSIRHCSRGCLCSTPIPSAHPDFTCRKNPRTSWESFSGPVSVLFPPMNLTSSAGVSAPLKQSLTNGGWEWEIAQPPCPTGAYAEEMFYTVPEGISSLPQSNMTYELSFRVLHTHLLTLLPATTSKTNSMHPNL